MEMWIIYLKYCHCLIKYKLIISKRNHILIKTQLIALRDKIITVYIEKIKNALLED